MIDVTTDQPQPNESPDIFSYERVLIEQHGAAWLKQHRAEMRPILQFGDTRTALGIGAVAPNFTLTDTAGKPYVLSELLPHGPVVALFYRGGWCPFCNVQLRAFQLASSRLRALKAQVVLISPQESNQSLSLIERHALTFPLLTDVGNHVARQYGLAFQLNPAVRDGYLAIDVDLAHINDDASWELPMPATFVIDRAGLIRYSFVSADYTQRSEPADVLAALQRIARGR